MTKYERIKSMSIEEMAKELIRFNIGYRYCKGDCGGPEMDYGYCEGGDSELQCCIKWLKEGC